MFSELIQVTILAVIILLITTTIVSLILSKTTHFRQYYIYRKLRPNIEKIVKNDWQIREINWFTMRRVSKNRYRTYVEVYNPRIINNKNWTNDFVTTDNKGNIIDKSLTDNIKRLTKYAKLNSSYNETKQSNEVRSL